MSRPETPKFQVSRLSLAQRMLAGALIWSILIVVGGVIAITAVYRAQALSLLEDELDGTVITLSRAIEIDSNSDLSISLDKLPPDPRFETPLSGRYWMIVEVTVGGDILNETRSRSTFDEVLSLPTSLIEEALARPGNSARGNDIGPYGEPILTTVQAITLPELENPLLLVASADRSETDEGASRLRTLLLIAMLMLAGGTLAAMWLGLRFALRPLNGIQSDIADVREGRRATLRSDYPTEVQPLSEELNKLLEHNRSVVQRARTHVGNLAHALKTPLAVLQNEASGDTQLAQTVRRQSEAMRSNVDHYLNRAQAAARAETLGVRTEIATAIDGLVRVMNKLYQSEGRSVESHVPAGVFVRVERQDLEEMLGNLVDNACKWAKSRIEVSLETTDIGDMFIHIDDDGKGLSAEGRVQALKRGVRLDETAPGTGLGLSIVADLAEMNAGTLVLKDSPLGGLRASLKLRRAS